MPSIKRGPRKPAPQAKIKVSQGTIDKIKGMGMQAALKKAARPSTSGDFVEGVKRMYGARRLTAAQGQRADKRIQKPSLRKAAPAKKAATKKAASKPKKVNWRKEGILPALKARGPIVKGKVSGPGYFKS